MYHYMTSCTGVYNRTCGHLVISVCSVCPLCLEVSVLNQGASSCGERHHTKQDLRALYPSGCMSCIPVAIVSHVMQPLAKNMHARYLISIPGAILLMSRAHPQDVLQNLMAWILA